MYRLTLSIAYRIFINRIKDFFSNVYNITMIATIKTDYKKRKQYKNDSSAMILKLKGVQFFLAGKILCTENIIFSS